MGSPLKSFIFFLGILLLPPLAGIIAIGFSDFNKELSLSVLAFMNLMLSN